MIRCTRSSPSEPDGGWLPPADVTALLRLYGIPLVAATEARTEDDAAAAATAVGYPVVVKADVPGLVHKTDAGAVLLDLRTEDDVRAGYRQLAGQFGGRLTGVLVEPMITGGTEVIIGVRDDQMFGPLVVFGLGGVATEVLADHAARLAPLTETDAEHTDQLDPFRAAAARPPGRAGSRHPRAV